VYQRASPRCRHARHRKSTARALSPHCPGSTEPVVMPPMHSTSATAPACETNSSRTRTTAPAAAAAAGSRRRPVPGRATTSSHHGEVGRDRIAEHQLSRLVGIEQLCTAGSTKLYVTAS
jgi:hypothetical protein